MRTTRFHLALLVTLALAAGASRSVEAGPTTAHLSLTNTARVTSPSVTWTNLSSAFTNIIVAEIHGMMDIVTTNTNAFIVPGGTPAVFSNWLTNKANLAERRLLLILTNGQTNASAACGDWTVEALSNGSPVLSVSSRVLCVPGGVQKILLSGMSIPPDGVFVPGVRLSAPGSAGPSSWLSVQLVTRVVTNAAGYLSFDGTAYGGRTNLLITARAQVASPNIRLFKFIDLVTNAATGLYEPVPGAEILYRIVFSNSGIGQGRHLNIIDYLPVTNIAYLPSTLVRSGFASNFSVSNFNRSGAAFAPAAVESNIRRIKFSATNVFNPGDTGTVRYRIRIR